MQSDSQSAVVRLIIIIIVLATYLTTMLSLIMSCFSCMVVLKYVYSLVPLAIVSCVTMSI